jgi:hypothetical protein
MREGGNTKMLVIMCDGSLAVSIRGGVAKVSVTGGRAHWARIQIVLLILSITFPCPSQIVAPKIQHTFFDFCFDD